MERLLAVSVALLGLAAVIPPGAPTEKPSLLSRIDHLVYAAPDLDRAVADLEARLGVRAAAGGQHPGLGTHNALLALGPTSYLEIIAPDPALASSGPPQVFGLDGLREPRLQAWAARATGLEQLREKAVRDGVPLGEVGSGSRKSPDGALLTWRFTSPRTVIAEGVVPFFIDWGRSPHPASTAPRGLRLVEFRAEHPTPSQVEPMLRALGLDLRVSRAEREALVAVIDGPRGRVELR